MKILVIGSGGREHTLVWKIAQSKRVSKLYVAPGNPGTQKLAENVDINAEDIPALLAFAAANALDLTVVGPEVPLAQGIVDQFHGAGLPIFGPTQGAAQIEASKAFAKELMKKYNIPTASYATFDNPSMATEYLKEQALPVVIKADGLAAGKGVVIATTQADALRAVEGMLRGESFGSAGEKVVIEEYLEGEEVSLLAFTDGKTVLPMVSSQDHKRAFDNDRGLNTGGMGAISPAPMLSAELHQKVVETILKPTVQAMAQEGTPFKGVLYVGLMLTAQGPKVVEFNCRFGDPEAQVVVPRLESDLVEIMLACLQGTLHNTNLKWSSKAAACVVLASGGYPQSYSKGHVIHGLEQLPADIVAFHAGTKVDQGQLVTNGGRVLGITAMGDTLSDAINRTYQGVSRVQFSGIHYRRDIGAKALRY